MLQQRDEKRTIEFAVEGRLFRNGHHRTHRRALPAHDAALTIQFPTLPQTREMLRTRQDENRVRRTRKNAQQTRDAARFRVNRFRQNMTATRNGRAVDLPHVVHDIPKKKRRFVHARTYISVS